MAEYQISPGTYARHLTWRGSQELRCVRCGEKILPGDWIHRSNASCFRNGEVSKGGKPKGIAKFYHLSCYEGLFV